MSKNIKYSAYWGTWSRILSRQMGPSKSWIMEVNLTDINGGWGQVPYCWIRVHGTAPGRGDQLERRVPDHVYLAMKEALGGDMRHFLITAPIMDMIDYEKYQNVSNCGAPLSRILKDGVELPEFVLAAYPGKVF